MKRLVLAHTNGPLAGLRRIVGRADAPEGWPAEMTDYDNNVARRTHEGPRHVIYEETFNFAAAMHARHAYLRGA